MTRYEWVKNLGPAIGTPAGEPTPHEVEASLGRAIRALVRHDSFLLETDANERSVTHKLAEYLQREFPDWHVDCEYNRVGSEPGDCKRLHGLKEELRRCGFPIDTKTDDTEGSTVFPDIIVHRRGTEDNLLVIEVKKKSASDRAGIDKTKLKLYKKELGYRFAAFLLVQSEKPLKRHPWCLEWLEERDVPPHIPPG